MPDSCRHLRAALLATRRAPGMLPDELFICVYIAVA